MKNSSTQERVRVAHLVSHPIQYFAPLYRAMEARPEIDLTVYFYSGESLKTYFDSEFGRKIEWDVPLLSGYKSVLFPVSKLRSISSGFDRRPNWPILKDLWRKKYDVVWLHGYASLNAWLALPIAKLRGGQVLLREEQTLLTARSGVKLFAKRLILPWMYRFVNGLYIGQNSRRFFEFYGTKSANLYPAPYCVDNAFFKSQWLRLRQDKAAIRERFGITSDAPVILFSGKLIDKKQPGLLLEAFKRLRQKQECHLLFAGDGPLRKSLEEKVLNDRIPDVHWAGFLNQGELPKAYAAADIFVLPSAYQETWGLVVNEAMNFRLPVIVSDHVGCGSDLVRKGENGCIFKSGDASALEEALGELASSAEKRALFGARSQEIVEGFSIENCAQRITEACLGSVGRGMAEWNETTEDKLATQSEMQGSH